MLSGISNSYGPLCLFFISKLSKMSQNQLQAMVKLSFHCLIYLMKKNLYRFVEGRVGEGV